MIEISPQGCGYLPEIPAKFFSPNLQSLLRHQDKGLGGGGGAGQAAWPAAWSGAILRWVQPL